MTKGICTTWTSTLGNTYDLTLDVTDDGRRIVVRTAYRHRDGMQRTRAPGMETDFGFDAAPSLDPTTMRRLERRAERIAQ